MTWLPKFAVCLSYYDRVRLRSDAFAALFLALQIFPLAIAIAVATGVPPIYGVLCAAIAGLLASAFCDSKIRVTAPNVVFVAVASSIVAREGILALSLSTLSAGVLLVFLGAVGLGAGIRMLPRPVVVGFSTGIAVLVVSRVTLLSTMGCGGNGPDCGVNGLVVAPPTATADHMAAAPGNTQTFSASFQANNSPGCPAVGKQDHVGTVPLPENGPYREGLKSAHFGQVHLNAKSF